MSLLAHSHRQFVDEVAQKRNRDLVEEKSRFLISGVLITAKPESAQGQYSVLNRSEGTNDLAEAAVEWYFKRNRQSRC